MYSKFRRSTSVRSGLFMGVCLALVSLARVSAQQTTSGQTQDSRAVAASLPFLTISPNARNGAMGDVGAAVTRDASAEFWNPAALARVEHEYGFGLAVTPWLANIIPDIYLAYLPAYFNFGEKGGVLGAHMRFFSLGNIQFTDEQGIETGEFNASEFSIGASYAHVITENWSVGGGLKYIRSDLASSGGVSEISAVNSAAGDIALHYQNRFYESSNTPIRFGFGLVIQNIGPKVQYDQTTEERDFIPTNMRLGVGATFEIDDYNEVTLALDFNKLMVPSPQPSDPNFDPSDEQLLSGMFGSFTDAENGFSEEVQEVSISFGAEYLFNDLFAARAGYFYEHPDKGNRQFLTLGAGIKFRIFELNASYLTTTSDTQNNPLQNTLRFGLGFYFDR